jgi:prophage regulatory protein
MSIESSPTRTGRLYRRKQILELLGISNATLYQWIRAGRFPAGIPIGPNTRAWAGDEIDATLQQRARERVPAVAPQGDRPPRRYLNPRSP